MQALVDLTAPQGGLELVLVTTTPSIKFDDYYSTKLKFVVPTSYSMSKNDHHQCISDGTVSVIRNGTTIIVNLNDKKRPKDMNAVQWIMEKSGVNLKQARRALKEHGHPHED